MSEAFLKRGQELAEARETLAEATRAFSSSIALTSIHSAIAYNNALQFRMSGTYFKGADHERASDMTKKLCKQRGIDAAGLQQFAKLLGNKTAYSYGDKTVTEEQAEAMRTASQRFQSWAERTLRSLS